MLPAIRHARPLRISAPGLNLAIGLQARQPRPLTSQIRSLSTIPSSSGTRPSLPLIPLCRTFCLTSRVWMSSKPPLPPKGIDKESEKEIASRKLEARPDEVSTESSVCHVVEQSQAPPESTPDVMEDLKGDIETVKETFALATVPREAYALGLSGTLPYLATSLSTIYLSWNLNTQWPTGSNFINSILLNHESAQYWLHLLEPIQVGYGAVIISFLGAVHWGLELGEKTPAQDRRRARYAVGVLAPAVAWPTIFMPIEWALTTQFAAFVALYFNDSRATVKGWAPAWYATYRFVLTAVVGVAIFLSLLGRAKVGEGHALSTAELRERMMVNTPSTRKHHNWEKEEAEERERIKEEKRKEEEKKKQEEKKKEEEKKKQAKKSGEKSGEKTNGKEKADEKKDQKKDGEKAEGKEKQAKTDEETPEEQVTEQEKPRQAKEGGKKPEAKDDGASSDGKKEDN